MNLAANNMEMEAGDVPAAMAPANLGNDFDNLGAQMRNLGQHKLQLNISFFNLMLFIFGFYGVVAFSIWMMGIGISTQPKSIDDENGKYNSMKMEINRLKEEMAKKEECEAFKMEIKGLKEEMEEKEKCEAFKMEINQLKKKMTKKEECEAFKMEIKRLKEDMAKKNEEKVSILDTIMGNTFIVCWFMLPALAIFASSNGGFKKENAIGCVAVVAFFLIVGSKILAMIVAMLVISLVNIGIICAIYIEN